MNSKDLMIDDYQRNQESPWLLLAKQLVREHAARMAQQKEQDHESIHRLALLKT